MAQETLASDRVAQMSVSEGSILSVNDHIRLTLADLHPEVSKFTYPLFALDSRDRPDLFASCVLIECDGVPVIVTAAHAISEITRSGSAVHIGAGQIVDLPMQFVLSSLNGKDSLDVAAMIAPSAFLSLGTVQVLPQTRTMLDREFANFHLRCVHGYPCTRNKQAKRLDKVNRKFTAFGFTYGGASRQISAVNYTEFDKAPLLHAALRYQDLGRNEDGKTVTPPHPKGMSGGGLWLLPDSARPSAVYLEGISIEFHSRKSLVFATRIQHVISFVRKFLLGQKSVVAVDEQT